MGKQKKRRFALNLKKKSQAKPQSLTKGNDMNWIQTVFDYFGQSQSNDQQLPCAREAIIYNSELEYIRKCILEYPRIETGGQLFGFWTPQGRPVVLYAIGPGPRAGHHSAFFEQDIDYLDMVGNAIVKTFGLCHIGEWHSHHQLGLAQPSGHDASNIQNNVDRLKLNHFLLCIGNCNNVDATLNPFLFYQGAKQYLKVTWNVVSVDSPFRSVIDAALKNVLVHPQTHKPDMSKDFSLTKKEETKAQIYNDGYWLSNKNNGLILKEIIDYVKGSTIGCSVDVKLDNTTKYVHIIVSSCGKIDHDICFDYNFPSVPPRITFYDIYFGEGKKQDMYDPTHWSFDGDILSTFKNYYPHIR